MQTGILKKNLLHLKSLHPQIYEAVKDPKLIRNYEVNLSNSGIPTLSYIKPNKTKIYLLSKYDPVQEAKRLISSINVDECTNFIVLGLGFGYQVIELIKSIPENSKIIVIETDKILARLAFETNDLTQILNYPGLNLIIPDQIKELSIFLDDEKINFSLNGYKFVQQNSLSEVYPEIFIEIRKKIRRYFQESTIELKTQAAKSKTFYKNISENFENMVTSPGIIRLKNALKNIPAIICSAGPSLDKNIQLLKAKRENFILISVATALNPLQQCHIYPDILVAIDPNELTAQFFNLEKNLKDTWLVYDPSIPPVIPTLFKGKRFIYDSPISLAQWMQNHIRENGSLGKVFSVAHAAYNLADFMGCSPIIFIGQDLSFSKKRLHSRNSYYYQRREDKINRLETMEILDGVKFNKYSANILQRKDIFNGLQVTTVAMDTYALILSTAINNIQNNFNSSEGGIGIKEIKNNLLREVLTHYCVTNIKEQKFKILNSISSDPLSKPNIIEPAKKQLSLFKEVSENLYKIEIKYLNITPITEENKEKFILEMKSIIRNLSNIKETVLLLQGYDFLGFTTWNQKSNEIMRKKNSTKYIDLVQREFQRDHDFFYVLKNSLEFNIKFFEVLAKEINAS